MQTKNLNLPDGWTSFMLELNPIGQPDGDSIRTKAPKIQTNPAGKVFTINYFARSWIDLELKVVGNWSPTGRYTSTFLWNTAGEFYKSKMNY